MMTSPTGAADTAIADYLDDLRDTLAPLPRDRRRELVRDIEAHIGAARAELGDPWSAAEVRTLLDRLGTPEEIAEAEGLGGDDAPPATPSSWREPLAIFLLLFGGFVAGFGWLAGLFLLWTSPRWRTGEKLAGTLLVPGGLATSLSVVAAEAVMGIGCDSAACQNGTGATQWGLLLLAIGAVGLPLVTAVYLGLALRRDRDRP